VDPSYRINTTGKQWLAHDAVVNGKRMLLLATQEHLALLARTPVLTGDGTFKVAPKTRTDDFQQLYVIGGVYRRHHFALAYAFMKDKAEETYLGLFGILKELMGQHGDLRGQIFVSDLESGVLAAIRQVFPTLHHNACFFHLGQSLWRHVQQDGLTAVYKEKPEFRIAIKELLALGFCRVEDVVDSFELLLQAAPPQARGIFYYWREYYISRQEACFPPALWGVRRRTLKAWPRTNNGQESHNRILGVVIPPSPALYTCLLALGREKRTTSKDIARLDAGRAFRRAPERSLVHRCAKLKAITQQCDELPRATFLRRIAKKLLSIKT
jgi:hypothetical protein